MDSVQIDKLFAQTLAGNYDDHSAWEAVSALQRLRSHEVCSRAIEWCSSDQPLKRARGADVLGQLGNTMESSLVEFSEERFSVIASLTQCEKDPLPLCSALSALGHIRNPRAVPLIKEHHANSNPEVRLAVAMALGSFANESVSVETLLILMQDRDGNVRDWATFGLGTSCRLDSDQIRAALFHQLTDSDADVRGEALVGLAKRHDNRVLPALIHELEQTEVSDHAFEAAETLLDDSLNDSDRNPKEYIEAIKYHFSL